MTERRVWDIRSTTDRFGLSRQKSAIGPLSDERDPPLADEIVGPAISSNCHRLAQPPLRAAKCVTARSAGCSAYLLAADASSVRS